MQELIKITTNPKGEQVVSARNLYDYLEVKTEFGKWCQRMFEYGFSENADYQCLVKIVEMPNGGQREVLDDYALTLDTAKEIAMLQRTNKGKQARQYFIEVEKQARLQSQAVAQSLPQTYADALRALAEKVESEAKLKAENAILAPKAKYTDDVLESVTEITTTTIAKELGMSAYALNKKLCEHKIQYYHDGHYVLGHIYHSNGYTETRTHTWKDKTGVTRTKLYTVWTERDRAFIHALFNTKLGFSNNTSNIQTVHLHEQETQR